MPFLFKNQATQKATLLKGLKYRKAAVAILLLTLR